ncbi:YceI family protein [Flavobacterium gyeonganense]|uniref:YceI family protein n=1 Tax=Flavobacterium gyeonganense TaxID=1310418 RepID=UPI0024145D2F|nr:YceI family protein [Flavobacterium gyeonganense]
MKRTIFFILMFTACSIIAQEKISTNKAIINFEATVPCFEEIKAVNKSVMIILDPKASTFLCTVPMRDFHFKLDLMEQHFNENYLESDRYPKAVFKGKIAKFDLKDIDETEKEYVIKGRLMIRGKYKEIEVKAFLKKYMEEYKSNLISQLLLLILILQSRREFLLKLRKQSIPS